MNVVDIKLEPALTPEGSNYKFEWMPGRAAPRGSPPAVSAHAYLYQP